MMASISLSDRIKGCLLGAAIGSELGFAREIRPEDFAQVTPDNVFDIPLKPALDYEPPANRAPLWRSSRRWITNRRRTEPPSGARRRWSTWVFAHTLPPVGGPRRKISAGFSVMIRGWPSRRSNGTGCIRFKRS